MQIEHFKTGETLVVIPRESRIDASSTKHFKGKMIDWINEGNQKIVLDLQYVEFIDSSGLGALVSCLKSLDNEKSLVLCNIQEKVASLFQLTRMNRVFMIFESQNQAVAALSRYSGT